MAESWSVKFLNLNFTHLKNTNKGSISFLTPAEFLAEETCVPNAFAFYGQNGSGKSTVILAFDILRTLFLGKALPKEIAESIAQWSSFATIEATLAFRHENEAYLCDYGVSLGRDSEGELFIQKETLNLQQHHRAWIPYAIPLSFEKKDTVFSFGKLAAMPLAKASSFRALSGDVDKKWGDRKSFLFDSATADVFASFGSQDLKDIAALLHLISSLSQDNFVVIKAREEGDQSVAKLFLPAVRDFPSLVVNLFAVNEVTSQDFQRFQKFIEKLNHIIPAFLPNLSLGVVKKSETADRIRFEFVSNVEGYAIPLRLESEGTKRLIVLGNALFSCYASPAFVLCVDELDSGIFEYLFGEIVKTMASSSEGQLIFTSHNLRALEILDARSLFLTTTNPDDRYEHYQSLEGKDNLRDAYLREAFLMDEGQHFCKKTSEYEIAKAFMKIGELYHEK